jgi:AraC-like DNA-binding protein
MERVEGSALTRSLRVEVMPEPHIHSEVEVNFLLEGQMTYLFSGAVQSLAAGELGLFWGTVPHRVIATAPPTSFVCLYLPIEAFLGLPAGGPFKSAIVRGHLLRARVVDPADASLFLRWHRDLETGDGRRAQLVREELASRLRRIDLEGWTDLSGEGGAEPRQPRARRMARAQRMARYIAENLERGPSVAEIAGAAALHPNYAMSLFKETLGLTIGQYVNRQRLSHAQAMLLSTDQDVTRIAFASGFGLLSRFYEAFKGRFGAAPVEYRRRHRPTAAEASGPPG